MVIDFFARDENPISGSSASDEGETTPLDNTDSLPVLISITL